jgi:hypothetical protein
MIEQLELKQWLAAGAYFVTQGRNDAFSPQCLRIGRRDKNVS